MQIDPERLGPQDKSRLARALDLNASELSGSSTAENSQKTYTFPLHMQTDFQKVREIPQHFSIDICLVYTYVTKSVSKKILMTLIFHEIF